MRRPSLLSLAAMLAAVLAASPSLGAQAAEPRRPDIGPGADTNSATLYHQYALQNIGRQPARAADAFYWAARLEPSAGQLYYGRYVASLLANRTTAVRYALGDEGTLRSRDVRRIDSLALRAFLRDPFLARQLFAHITREAVYALTGMVALPQSNDYPEFSARIAYENGNYADAAMWYGRAIRRSPRNYWLRDARADAFFLSAQYDSAIADLHAVLAEQRKRDAKRLVFAYESKAMTEFRIGWALAYKGDVTGAREAYARALTEDISFWRAHEALGDAALAQGDTAMALQEFELATQIATGEAPLQEKYGVLLASRGRLDESIAALTQATTAEPLYALPYFALAQAFEMKGSMPEALARYRQFVARASLRDPRRAAAVEQVATLTAAGVQ